MMATTKTKEETVIDNSLSDTTPKTSAKSTKPVKIRAKDIDREQYITVKNGTQGRLIFVAPKSGETYTWDKFGDEQEIQLEDLIKAKNTRGSKKFFTENWFVFNDEEDWVIDYLGMRQYYKDSLKIDNFDDIFTKSVSEIEGAIEKLSNGQKRTLAYRARQLVEDGKIDSLSVIKTIEKATGVEVTDKATEEIIGGSSVNYINN